MLLAILILTVASSWSSNALSHVLAVLGSSVPHGSPLGLLTAQHSCFGLHVHRDDESSEGVSSDDSAVVHDVLGSNFNKLSVWVSWHVASGARSVVVRLLWVEGVSEAVGVAEASHGARTVHQARPGSEFLGLRLVC